VVWKFLPLTHPTLTLEWVETGGPAVAPLTKAGYGTIYVRLSLAAVFGESPL
jgi:hypothetical protein